MQNSKRIVFLLIFIFTLMLFFACHSKESGSGDNPSYAQMTESGNPNELMMEVILANGKHLKKAAELYEEKNGIKIIFKDNYVALEWTEVEYIDEFGEHVRMPVPVSLVPDMSVYTQKVVTELMTRSGADIYDVGFLDFEQLGKNGLLVDMGDWLENDSAFSDDTHFQGILLSGKTESGVFAIPLDFGFFRLVARTTDEPFYENRQMMWQERMTWTEFFDKVAEVGYTQDRAFGWTELVVFMDRFVARASHFIDETGKTEALNSEEMISLLEECRDWRDIGLVADSNNLVTLTVPHSYGAAGGNMYKVVPHNPYNLCNMPEEYSDMQDRFFWWFAPKPFDGEIVSIDGIDRYPEIFQMTLYGVNASSPKAEMAQDFLRFLLSEEAQEIMNETGDLNFPVNRAVFRNSIESDLKEIQEYMRSKNDDLEELDIPALKDEAEGVIDQIGYFILERPYYRSIILEVAKEFFLGKISAEEAALQMSNKVSLYLKEHG